VFDSSATKTILRLIAVLALLLFGAWSFWGYQRAQDRVGKLEQQLQTEVTPTPSQPTGRQLLLARVGRLIDLPPENPLIFDIENADAIAESQPFFAGAVDGDKLLIYSQAELSIIYSPSRDIIVKTGKLVVQDFDQEATPSTSNSP
jgi:hypothetical protein